MAQSSSADPVAPHEPGVSKLAAKVAHELNNPLDAVLRYVSLAQRKAKSGQFSDIERYLADAQFGLQRMAEVLRELMDIGRQTNDILSQSNTVPLADLIAGAIRTAAAHAEQKHVALIIKNLLPTSLAPAYDLRLSQVLANLLKNAIEASPETTTVRITVDSGQRPVVSGQNETAPPTDHWPLNTDHSLTIHIEDSGPGLPPTLLPSLFTPFVTTKPKGTGHGLGLAISRELIASLHGNLTLENRPTPHTGCLATITLPLTQPSPPSPAYQLPVTNY